MLGRTRWSLLDRRRSLEGAWKLLLSVCCCRWNENDYYVTDGRSIPDTSSKLESRGLTFDEWRRETGFDSKSTFTKGSPTKLRVIVRPNASERARAHLWCSISAALPEVEVDLSPLHNRLAYRIVSAQGLFPARLLVTGTYDGKPVRVPMQPVRRPGSRGPRRHIDLPITERHTSPPLSSCPQRFNEGTVVSIAGRFRASACAPARHRVHPGDQVMLFLAGRGADLSPGCEER